MQKQTTVCVVVGPSGSGKTTLCKRVLELRSHFTQCITTTTRAQRPGEVDGVHYHFLSEAEFIRRKKLGAFVETAQVHTGAWYGTTKEALLSLIQKGGFVLLSVDLQGLFSIKGLPSEALGDVQIISIFVDVPRPWKKTLTTRLKGRKGGISKEDLEARLKSATWEMARISAADYRVINDDLGEAVKAILDITNRYSAVYA
jgi:guanylate kinase